MPLHVSRISNTEQIFTHEDVDGTLRHFAVERLFNYMKGLSFEVFDVVLEHAYVDVILQKRGVEDHRLKRLTPEQLMVPVLYLEGVTPGTHLLADGHHRYVVHSILGSRYIPSYIAPPKLWTRFMVNGIPEHVGKSQLNGFSGIH